MAVTPVVLNDFGGLRTYGDPEDFGSAAVDIKNVRMDVPGKLPVRGGSTQTNSTTNASVVGLHRWDPDPATFRVAVIMPTQVRRYTATNASVNTGSLGTLTGAAVNMNDKTYFGRSDNTILEMDAAGSYANIGSDLITKFLTVSGVEGRIVAAHCDNGSPLNPDRVRFSASGDPTLWATNDFVDIWPKDGQEIRAAVTFRDSVFVFKDHRFAVFYGESVDADGLPVFNYRPVDTGIGCAYDFGATVGPDGVYFISNAGIYRTTGDAPVLISQALQGVFDGSTSGLYTGPTSISSPRLFASVENLYFVNNSKVFVFNYAAGTWSLFDFPAGVQYLIPTADFAPRSFLFVATDGSLYTTTDATTTDAGAAISWLYTSGLYTLSDPGRVAITLESRVWGTGTVTLKVANDHGSLDTGSALTLGTSPATADAWQQIDREGVFFQHQFSGSGQAAVNRLAHMVSFVKPAGIG